VCRHKRTKLSLLVMSDACSLSRSLAHVLFVVLISLVYRQPRLSLARHVVISRFSLRWCPDLAAFRLVGLPVTPLVDP
jgi:hypothetical protein